MKYIKLTAKGFTLLELMIATIIFSTILLATTTVLIQLGRMYYKGVIINRTQETTRSVTDEMSQQLQFGGNKMSVNQVRDYGGLQIKAFCVGTQRYSYVINAKVSSKAREDQAPSASNGHILQHALWRDTIATGAGCTPLDLRLKNPGGTDGQELLGQNMRLSSNFKAPECQEATGLCTLTVAVVYGDDNLLTDGDTKCGNVIGSQWCAASTISTQVFKRLQTGA